MGARNSRLPSPGREGDGERGGRGEGQAPSDPSSSSRPTPFIEAPYAGPWAEYQFADVTAPVLADVTLASDVTTSSSAGDVSMASTRTGGVLEALEGVYSQGYSLVTICRVPGGGGCGGGGGGGGGGGNHRGQVFVPGREVRYQGIFCRYEGDPGNEGWKLRAEKSLLHVHHVTPGVVSSEAGPGSQHVERLISRTAQIGGRLLTVQWTGQPLNTSGDNALGVDVFFEVPDQALPERSVYQLVTAPATLVKRSLFASKGHVTCDWSGILTRHLARGWRLVDVFCESLPVSSSVSASLSPSNAKIQTVWFFEKPESRARDDSAVYEGSVVEHWIDVTSSVSSSSSSWPLSGGASSCLGSGRGDCKKGGSLVSKRSFTKRMASLRNKSEDTARGESDAKRGDDVKQGSEEQKTKTTPQPENVPASSGETTSQQIPNAERNHVGDHPSQTIPSPGPNAWQGAGWERVIRSMGEKGWELASIINTMDTQLVAGMTKVKVLLVFQRKISLVMTVKGRRTSDGLALRSDTGASTSAMCDIPMMTGDTASYLNPSLAVRLPLSRSASRDQDDFRASCDDDIPSTIGGSCSRTVSATDLSSLGRGLDTNSYLEVGGRESLGKGREEGGLLLQPSSSLGDEGSVGTSSQHSRVTAAEVHVTTTCTTEIASSGERTPNDDGISASQKAKGGSVSNQKEGGKDSSDEPTNHSGEADRDSSETCLKEASKNTGERLPSQNVSEENGSGLLSNQHPCTSKDLGTEKIETTPQMSVPESQTLRHQPEETLGQGAPENEEQSHVLSQETSPSSVSPESIELAEHPVARESEPTELVNTQCKYGDGHKTTNIDVDAATGSDLPSGETRNKTELSPV